MTDIPLVETLASRQVLATYGQTMTQVQALEATLKQIVGLYNYLEKNQVGLVDDATCDAIFSEHDRSPLGKILKSLEARTDKVEEKVRNEALRQLNLLRDTRNSLAHNYLVTHQPFIDHPEGRTLVIAQLRHYAHNFKIAADLFWGLLSHLLTSIMGPPHFQDTFMRLWQEAMTQAVESVGLKHYRKKLQECGAI